MFVLFDVEWITDKNGTCRMTQLAAVRTSAAWYPCAEFRVLAAPQGRNVDWEHFAYSGYSPDEFRFGESEQDCMRAFFRWLRPDDVLCCWNDQQGKTLEFLYEQWQSGELPLSWAAADRLVYGQLEKRGIFGQGGLYNSARQCGLELPVPEHCSSNDVAVMQMLFRYLHLPHAFLTAKRKNRPVPLPSGLLSQREETARWVANSPYNYLFLADSPVFHRRGCKLILNSKQVLGSVHYGRAIQERRPCMVCKPVQLTEEEEYSRAAARESLKSRLKKAQSTTTVQETTKGDEVHRVKLLGGQRIEIRQKLLVGCCHNQIHPGKLTRQLMENHDCIGKKCHFFEKYEDASYWLECAQKAAARQQIKQQKKEQKAQEKTRLSYQEEFQTYADDAGYVMKIIRVQEEETKAFKVFYVSENRFRDGNLFPNFLSRIQKEHPARSILMRHIQDMDGHFVTIEEYANIRK